MKKQIEKLALNFEKLVQDYVDLFCDKHEVTFEGWVGDDTGTIGEFNDYYFDFETVRRDIDDGRPLDEVFEWYDYSMDETHNINHKSWCMGARPQVDDTDPSDYLSCVWVNDFESVTTEGY